VFKKFFDWLDEITGIKESNVKTESEAYLSDLFLLKKVLNEKKELLNLMKETLLVIRDYKIVESGEDLKKIEKKLVKFYALLNKYKELDKQENLLINSLLETFKDSVKIYKVKK